MTDRRCDWGRPHLHAFEVRHSQGFIPTGGGNTEASGEVLPGANANKSLALEGVGVLCGLCGGGRWYELSLYIDAWGDEHDV